MTSGGTTLTVSGRALEKRFGAVTALRSVDLEIEGGQAVAILGPNGAGKSTLLRILAGLARPTRGALEIRHAGRAVRHGRAPARALVGFAGHATLLYPELSARENLLFQARLHGVADAEERARSLLAEEGLAGVSERLAGTFSRGMAQRLSIARALVQDPPLLLLDEPFTGLDRVSGDRLSERLRGLRDEGRAIVLVTHDLIRASEIADGALVLLGGEVVHRAARDEMAADALTAAYAGALDAAAAAAPASARPRA